MESEISFENSRGTRLKTVLLCQGNLSTSRAASEKDAGPVEKNKNAMTKQITRGTQEPKKAQTWLAKRATAKSPGGDNILRR